MTVETTTLGPGTLTITPPGPGTPISLESQLEGGTVAWSKNKADDVIMVSGEVRAGSTTYTAQLSGTVDQDLADVAGVVVFTWANRGQVCDFVYVPNTAADATVTGQLVVDPLDIGGDTGGDVMTSDFTWDCVGMPVLTHGSLVAA